MQHPNRHPSNRESTDAQRILYRLTWLAAALSLGHHLDVYPVIATGLWLYRAGRVGPGFWALVSGGGAVFVAAVHFGPAAVEPPDLILGGYAPPILGWLAFTWLVVFVAVLAITCLYETRLWWRQRQTRRGSRPATHVGIGR